MIERIPSSPPEIKPVSGAIRRPLWSVMIPAYNCSHYLAETLESVLIQAPDADQMQIEVVDDFSTDANVEELVNRVGRGRVQYFRQPENVGSLRNFETCLNRSTGYYIHLLHGDDKIEKGFYSEIEQVFSAFPSAGAAFTGYTVINDKEEVMDENKTFLTEPGILENWILQIGRTQLLQPPAVVVKRSVYEKLGSFFAVHYGEDWEMWVRIAANFPVAHSPKKLAFYRVHENNITSRGFVSGQSMTDIMKVIKIVEDYLPKDKQKSMTAYAKRHFANYFSYSADKIYHEFGLPQVALLHARRAMLMHFSFVTLYYWVKIKFKMLIGYKQKREKKWVYKPLNFFR
jgi:glycosyltransferase involved in cell wall biosynthesis